MHIVIARSTGQRAGAMRGASRRRGTCQWLGNHQVTTNRAQRKEKNDASRTKLNQFGRFFLAYKGNHIVTSDMFKYERACEGAWLANIQGIWRRLLPIIFVGVVTLRASAMDLPRVEPVKSLDQKLPMAAEVFEVEGHSAFLILPTQKSSATNRPWIWYAPTLPDLPGKEEQWMFQKFLAAGIAIAGVDVGESYGNPQGRAVYSALYGELVRHRGLSQRVCLLARSRGGLMLYNWAAEHPFSVACLAGIYPACNLSSYPGLKVACNAYGMTEEQLSAELAKHNPIDRLEPLAKAHVAIFHLHGDRDAIVPLEKNSGELARRYRQLGGTVILRVIEGQGHNRWSGWFQSQELVDFVIAHAGNPSVSGPDRP